MPRRTALLHIGPGPTTAGPLHEALSEHADLLGQAGRDLVPVSTGELHRAALEMLREHRTAGLRRRDVEGSWAGICRRAHRDSPDSVISQPRFADATADQAALIVDGLAGFEVHVVITTTVDETTTSALVDIWARCVRPGRLHVVDLDCGAGVVDVAEELAGLALCIDRDRLSRKLPGARHRLSRRRGELSEVS